MHTRPTRPYRPELDGIRALAIMAVIAYHAGVPYFSRGFVGVDFFFVISGYLITGILAQEALATGRLDLKAFYARRIRRLMPAALVMLTVCVALYAWFIPPVVGNYLALVRSVAANAFFVSNFFFYKQANGYFDESMTQFPLLHTWSLSVEEQYYVLWPLLIWGVLKWQTRAAQQENFNLLRQLRGLLWGLGIASFSFCVYYTLVDDKFSFYLLPARVWEFAAGGLLALYLRSVKRPAQMPPKQPWLGTGLATLGVILCVLSIHFVDSNTLYYQGAWAIWPVGATTALIAGLTLNRTGIWSRFFSLRPLVWLGLLSYSWYLWHWPLLTIHKIYALGGDTLSERVVICLVALMAAYASYRFVEQPIREHKPWLFATSKGTLTAQGLMIVLALALAGLVDLSKIHQQSNPYQHLLKTSQEDAAHLSICPLQEEAFASLKICGKISNGPVKNRPIIVLWGDSHANHYFPALVAMYPDHDIHKLAFPGCPPLIDDGLAVYSYTAACQSFNKLVITHIRSLGSQLSGVYLAARWPHYFGQAPVSVTDIASYELIPGASATMQTGLTHTLNQLSGLPVTITLLGAAPELVYAAPKCLAMRPAQACNVSRSVSDAYLNPSQLALQAVAKTLPSVALVDMRPYFCDTRTCFASKAGRPLYTDANHITAATASDLAVYLMR